MKVKSKNTENKSSNDSEPADSRESSSFSITQVLSVVSIVVSLPLLYYKRKELMSLMTPQPTPKPTENNTKFH